MRCIFYSLRISFSRTCEPSLWNVIMKKDSLWNVIMKKDRTLSPVSVGGLEPKFHNGWLAKTGALSPGLTLHLQSPSVLALHHTQNLKSLCFVSVDLISILYQCLSLLLQQEKSVLLFLSSVQCKIFPSHR